MHKRHRRSTIKMGIFLETPEKRGRFQRTSGKRKTAQTGEELTDQSQKLLILR